MIDFSAIQLTLDDKYSFVGIKRHKNKLVFFLPHGFDELCREKNVAKKFEQTRTIFFSLYKTFKRFQTEFKASRKIGDRDGVVNENGGFEFISHETNENIILYSKIIMIDAVLDSYDELRMFTFLNKQAKTNQFDYSQLYKYLDKAVFLSDGSMYIEEIELPKKSLHYDNTDLIRMFCFIYLEVKEQLGEAKGMKSEIIMLAQQFRETYLTNNDSLFSQQSYQQTLLTLQDVLAKIDQNTSCKDEDYWHFYEAIEKFLYGDIVFDSPENSAGYWGINAFYPIWEVICDAFVRKYAIDLIEFMDGEKETRFAKANVFDNLRPDLVLRGHFAWWNEATHLHITLIPDHNWDDFGYRMSFGLEIKQNEHIFKLGIRPKFPPFKITYEGQDAEHTSKKLIECGILDNNPNGHHCLLKKLEQGIFSNAFCLLLDPHSNLPTRIINQLAYYLNDISLEILLRQKYHSFRMTGSLEELYRNIYPKEFYSKIAKEIYQFQIIDYKYYPYRKLLKEEAVPEYSEERKIKDLRKQIVYEYKLQSFLKERIETLFSEHPFDYSEVLQKVKNGEFFKINSEFWLPYYSCGSNDFYLTPLGSQFKCDKLIKIRLINFEKLISNYLVSEIL